MPRGKVTVLLVGLMAMTAAGRPAFAEDSARGWQGFYAGLALGGAYSAAGPNTAVVLTPGIYFDPTDAAQVNPILQRTVDGTDVTGSVLAGYEFQSGHFLFGIEGDLTLMDFSENQRQGQTVYNSQPTLSFSTETNVETKFMFALRPKIGYTAGNYLFYASAGPSVSRFKTSTFFSDTYVGSGSKVFSDSKLAFGGSTSLGVGYQLGDGWSLRGDYVFTYFPDILDGTDRFSPDNLDDFKFDADFQSHNLRVALIKHF